MQFQPERPEQTMHNILMNVLSARMTLFITASIPLPDEPSSRHLLVDLQRCKWFRQVIVCSGNERPVQFAYSRIALRQHQNHRLVRRLMPQASDKFQAVHPAQSAVHQDQIRSAHLAENLQSLLTVLRL